MSKSKFLKIRNRKKEKEVDPIAYFEAQRRAHECGCSNCGSDDISVLKQAGYDNYKCKACGYRGNFAQEDADRSAVADEMLASYDEEEKCEVYDNDCYAW